MALFRLFTSLPPCSRSKIVADAARLASWYHRHINEIRTLSRFNGALMSN